MKNRINMSKINEAVTGDHWVAAIDKKMSNWGGAQGGNSVVLVHCSDDQQAYACEKAMRDYSPELKNIRTYYGKKPNIRNAAHVQELEFLKCRLWSKDYKFTHNISESKNAAKRTITESQIKDIVSEAVKNVLNELGL